MQNRNEVPKRETKWNTKIKKRYGKLYDKIWATSNKYRNLTEGTNRQWHPLYKYAGIYDIL